MYEDILNRAMTMNKASAGNLQILNKNDESLEIVVSSGLSSQFVNHFTKVNAHDGSVCARAMRTRKTAVVEDLSEDKFFAPHLQVALNDGIHSVQSTPLISKTGQFVGIISVHFKLPRHRLQTKLLNFENFCGKTADMIESYLN
jgi:GAF domain-containing protein